MWRSGGGCTFLPASCFIVLLREDLDTASPLPYCPRHRARPLTGQSCSCCLWVLTYIQSTLLPHPSHPCPHAACKFQAHTYMQSTCAQHTCTQAQRTHTYEPNTCVHTHTQNTCIYMYKGTGTPIPNSHAEHVHRHTSHIKSTASTDTHTIYTQGMCTHMHHIYTEHVHTHTVNIPCICTEYTQNT